MTRRITPRTTRTSALVVALALALLLAACGNDDTDTNGSDVEPLATATDNGSGSEPTEPADTGQDDADNGNEGGTITIGGESWTVVPEIQCAFFPGPVVYVAGHAMENSEIEITIDYEPDADFISAAVQGPDDDPYWVSQDEAISMEIDGQTLRGEGTFTAFFGGDAADGSFEVSCN